MLENMKTVVENGNMIFLESGLPWWFRGKESACQIREMQVQSLSWEDPPGEGNGNPIQCSCLGNSMDGGAWRATVHGGHKESDTTLQLNNKLLE